jgi:hypothetical protein
MTGAKAESPGMKRFKSMNEHIDALLTSVDGSAEWRADKAIQYPDDKRNIRSSESLAKLSKRLHDLPYQDPKLRTYSELIARGLDAGVDFARYGEFQNTYIGRYGFDYPADGDPDSFMDGLVEHLTELVEESEKHIKKLEEEEAFAALEEEAGEEVKERSHKAADKAAKEAADAAAKVAAQEAYNETYKETYEETYKEVYEETYRKDLEELLAERE